MDLMNKLRDAFTAFTTELGSLRRRRETLLRQREDLLSQAATRADITALLHAWVDCEREQFLETLGRRLQPLIQSPPVDMLAPDVIKRHTSSNFLGIASAVNGGGVSARAVDEMIAGLFATTMKTFVASAINELRWPGEEGLPLAERRAKLAKLDAEIDELSRRESELLAAAAASRVTVD
jgi:hypothetical protein